MVILKSDCMLNIFVNIFSACNYAFVRLMCLHRPIIINNTKISIKEVLKIRGKLVAKAHLHCFSSSMIALKKVSILRKK